MNELHLFAGAGGGILGSELLGIRTICAVELEPYPASVLLARQNDGLLPPFPVWDDVCTFDGRPWRGIVDVVSGGFPCQDISVSGKRKGLEGARSGLWSEMARIICEVRPGFVFLENSPNLTRLGLDRVLGNLAEMGYDAEWCVLGADAIGLPHHRARLWLLAHAAGLHRITRDSVGQSRTGRASEQPGRLPGISLCQKRWEASQGHVRVSVFRRPDDGMAAEVDELEAIGNGQVPGVAATAFRVLLSRFQHGKDNK
uniref:DNA cytosine methyltransferase n=1 Tax=Akkermansia muciniphila TaxID=239935 RepID=UPI0040265394